MKESKLEKYADWHDKMENKYPGITLLVHFVALLIMNLATKPNLVLLLMLLITLPTGLYTIVAGSKAFKFIPRYNLSDNKWYQP